MINEEVIKLIVRENRRITKAIISRRTERDGVPVQIPCRGREIPAWLHRCPGKDIAPVFVYLHSGSLTFGTADENDNMCALFAKKLGMHVLGVDYRLVPEAPYPAALEDVCECLEYISAMGTDMGFDKNNIILGGASAGGGLALSAMFEKGKYAFDNVRALVLMYPFIDCDKDPFIRPELEGSIDPDVMTSMINYYDPDKSMRRLPMLSPIYASDEQIKMLPPVVMISAQLDSIITDAYALEKRLKVNDIPVFHQVFNGAGHNFMEYGGDTDTYEKMPETMHFCRVDAFPMMTWDAMLYISNKINKFIS